MTPPETPPQPESTYRLLLDAAGAWPDGIATQWIPGPADHTRCLDWTYAELAGTATRIANALTVLGVRRQDAVTLSSVNTSMLYAATLAAQAVGIAAPVNPALSSERIAELVRRTGSRVLVAAGPELDPQLWQRLLEVARQAGMTAVLALRADGAHGDPPALGLTGDAPAAGTPDTPNGRGPFVAYLDDVIAGQPADHLAGADPPKAGDLAAFVHTGGTTGAPKVAAHTHANQLACGRGIAECSGLAPGEAMLGGLPLFHVNALIVTGIAPMFSGARVVWPGPAGYRDKTLYTRFWTIIEHYQIAAMSAVPTVYGTLAQVPVDADISTLRRADRRRVPAARLGARGLRRAHRAAPAGRLRPHRGHLRHHLDQAGRGTPRIGRPRPARAADQGRHDRRRRVLDRLRPGPDRGAGHRRPRRVRRVRHRPRSRRSPGQPGRHRARRLAGHRRPGPGGRRRLRVPDRAGQGPDHPRRPQHRPPGDRGRAAGSPAVRAAAAVGRPDRHSGEVPVAYVVPAGPGPFDETELLAWAGTAIGEAAARPKRIYPIAPSRSPRWASSSSPRCSRTPPSAS